MTTGIEFEIKFQKDAEKAVSVVSVILSSIEYIEGNHLPKERLLMGNTSAIYLNVKVKDFASFIFLFFTRF